LHGKGYIFIQQALNKIERLPDEFWDEAEVIFPKVNIIVKE